MLNGKCIFLVNLSVQTRYIEILYERCLAELIVVQYDLSHFHLFFQQLSGATLLNLSLLTSDMWAVAIRVFAYHQVVCDLFPMLDINYAS